MTRFKSQIPLTLTLLSMSISSLWAAPSTTQLPTGGVVVAGQASIHQSGSQMNVLQTSQKAVLDWKTFNVGSSAQVNFAQPSASAVALNRIYDTQPSEIFGRVTSNGQIILANQNGLYFGPTATVDVGGLVATTHSISNDDFMSGRFRFDRLGATGAVINKGEITARYGGYIALLAPEVRNEGVIAAQMGTVALAAGEAYELHFSNGPALTSIRVEPATIHALVDNRNAITVPGGLILLSAQAADRVLGSVVNNLGVIEATGLSVQGGKVVLDAGQGTVNQQATLASAGGEIHLIADNINLNQGVTTVASTSGSGGVIQIQGQSSVTAVSSHVLDASGIQGGQINVSAGPQGGLLSSSKMVADGTEGVGGQIDLLGLQVSLLNVPLSAKGTTQGGGIHVGGAWQGGSGLQTSNKTLIGNGSTLDVSSIDGVGGEIVVWSDAQTHYWGAAKATGGLKGGRIEVSSKNELVYGGTVNAGLGGFVLFDPKNITIGNAGLSVTWLSTLTSPDAVDQDFGAGLAVDGNLLAVGAPAYNSYEGRVYLYSGINTTPTLNATLSSGAGATGMPTFSAGNKYYGSYSFGKGLALKDGVLAVGAPYHALTSNVPDGAVYLFTGVGTDFSGLTYSKLLTTGTGATNMPSSFTNPLMFGYSIDIDSGNMVVGSYYNNNPGAVLMFSGVGTDFTGLTYKWFLDNTTKPAALTTDLTTESRFGSDVALRGDNLVVGSTGYNSYGAVYLFSGVNNSITNAAANQLIYRAKIGSMTNIGQDAFGQSVALYDDYLLVGTNRNQFVLASGVNNVFAGTATTLTNELIIGNYTSGTAQLATSQPAMATTGKFGAEIVVDSSGNIYVGDADLSTNGAVHFMNLGLGTSSAVATATYANSPAADSIITPSAITAVLNTGSSLTLQANNDITVSATLTANNSGGNGGDLTLEAGRHVTFNQSVTTDNGSLTVVAGAAGADAGNRDAGTPTITVASGKNINVGSGNLSLTADLLTLTGTLSGTGNLTIQPSTSSRTIGIAGGSGSLSLPASYFSTNISNGFSLITVGSATSGDIGFGTSAMTYNDPLKINTGGNINLASSASLTGNGNGLILNSDIDTNGGGITFAGSATLNTGGGSLVMGGGTCTFVDCTAAAISTGVAGTGGIHLAGTGANPIQLSSGGGAIWMSGQGTSAGGAGIAMSYSTLDSGAAGSITLRGSGIYTSTANGNGHGVFLTRSVVRGGSGGLNVQANANANGASNAQYSYGLGLGISSSGDTKDNTYLYTTDGGVLTLNLSTTAGVTNDTNYYFGEAAGGLGHSTLQNGNINITLSGTETLTPTLPNINLPTGNLSVTSHRGIAAGGTQSIVGSTTIVGGGTALDVALGTSGSFNTGSLQISDAKNISVWDTSVLSLGTLSNIAGTVSVSTTTGNLTLTGNITTTDATSNAIQINAARSIAAGTSTGGDILVTGSPVLTVGTGGAVKLYSGSVAGSTGLSTLVGSGSGRFRYNSDESSTGYTAALSTGLNAIFREQPTLTVTAANVASTYSGGAYSGGGGVTTTGLVHGDLEASLTGTISYTGTGQGAVAAGTYTIVPSGYSSTYGYAISYTAGTLNIGKATLAVTTANALKAYDGLAYSGGNGVTYSGFVNGENAGVLGGTLSYGGTSQGAINVGSYTLLASGLSSSNYDITYAAGTLNIGKATLVVTAANASKTYDGLAYSGGNGVTYTGFVNGESAGVLGGALSYGGTSQGAINAGSYTLLASGLSSTTYDISYTSGTLNISKAPLSIRATNASKTYDGLAYTGGNGVTYSGFVNGENVGALTGTVSYGGNAQGAVNAGSYTLSASGLSGSNYEITYAAGVLEVGKAPLVATAVNASKTYDGSAYAGGNGVTYSGFVNGESAGVLGGVLSYGGTSQGAINAGSYTLSANGLSSSNYDISYLDGVLTITQVIQDSQIPRIPTPTLLPAVSNAPVHEILTIIITGEGASPNVPSVVHVDFGSELGSGAAITTQIGNVLETKVAAPVTEVGAPLNNMNATGGTSVVTISTVPVSELSGLASVKIETPEPSVVSTQSVSAVIETLVPAQSVLGQTQSLQQSLASGFPAALSSASNKLDPGGRPTVFDQVLIQQLAKGASPTDAVNAAKQASIQEATASMPDTPVSSGLKAISSSSDTVGLAKQLEQLSGAKTTSGGEAFDRVLAVALAKGMSMDEAVRSAQSAAQQADTLVGGDRSVVSQFAQGGGIADKSSVTFERTLSSLIASGLSPAQALARANRADASASASDLADASNPDAALAQGSLLGNGQRSSTFERVLSAALAKGMSLAKALARANSAEQGILLSDRSSAKNSLASGAGNLPTGPTGFDAALGSALARGVSPTQALILARQAAENVPVDKQTASTALASGRSVDNLLSSPANSAYFKKALSVALSKGVPIEKALSEARSAEERNAYRFPLPANVLKLAADSRTSPKIQTDVGEPLPSWVQYVPEKQSFLLFHVPDGALPMKVVIRVGNKESTVTIADQSSRH